jgi:hypothetical protein
VTGVVTWNNAGPAGSSHAIRVRATNSEGNRVLTWEVHVLTHQPQHILFEPFDYPDGPLTGRAGWVTHSGVTGQVRVVGGTAQASHLLNSEDVNVPFAARPANAKTYASFKLKMLSYTSGSDYFLHFKDTGTLNFRARVFVSPPTATGYRIGIAASSGGVSPTVDWPSDLDLNRTYRIVIAWDAGSGTADLWVDPVSESSSRVTSGPFGTAVGPSISAVAIREGSAAQATMQLDDLTVGASFLDAIPLSAVPSMSAWGVMMLGSLLAAASAWFLGRRRHA